MILTPWHILLVFFFIEYHQCPPWPVLLFHHTIFIQLYHHIVHNFRLIWVIPVWFTAYYIPCKRWHISFGMVFDYFVFSGPFIRFLYSWDFPMSVHITEFIWLGLFFTLPVASLVINQTSLVWRTNVDDGMLGYGRLYGSHMVGH